MSLARATTRRSSSFLPTSPGRSTLMPMSGCVLPPRRTYAAVTRPAKLRAAASPRFAVLAGSPVIPLEPLLWMECLLLVMAFRVLSHLPPVDFLWPRVGRTPRLTQRGRRGWRRRPRWWRRFACLPVWFHRCRRRPGRAPPRSVTGSWSGRGRLVVLQKEPCPIYPVLRPGGDGQETPSVFQISPPKVTMYAVFLMISSEVGWFSPLAITVKVPSPLTRSS
jgi:hypothetical protein